MSLRISNLRLPIDMPEANLPDRLAWALALPRHDLLSWRILRKSLDVRDKHAIDFVYSVEVSVPDEPKLLAQRFGQVQVAAYHETPFTMPDPGQKRLSHRPVVVGSGPGGLAAAYFLAERGYQPLLLERGPPVSERIRDVKAFDEGGEFKPESNYLFGEGGAGTFSDGKLTCRMSGPDIKRILELFAECKGKPEIMYEHRPHLGSNRLPAVVKAMRQRIEQMGGEVKFHCRVEDIDLRDGMIHGLATSAGFIATEVVVLAIGHSARDTYAMLHQRGVSMEQKPFQFGVRIEHPQNMVNRVQYGSSKLEEKLGSADYSVIAHGPHDLFTFCMCAGGYVIPSVSEAGYFCTNGMSLSKRDSFYANSGLVVTVPTEAFGGSDILAGVRLQQQYEARAFALGRGEYRCPVQRAVDFLHDKISGSLPETSYPRGGVSVNLAELLPDLVRDAVKHGLPIMDRRWHGRFLRDAVLAAPEARGSSPVRMLRTEPERTSPGVDGLYPVGEGAGYAGGIVSAAVDGLRTARAIIGRYAPLTVR
jgi:uncharacterized FAD-dependent dehydrogenase